MLLLFCASMHISVCFGYCQSSQGAIFHACVVVGSRPHTVKRRCGCVDWKKRERKKMKQVIGKDGLQCGG